MSRLVASGGQSIGASVLPMTILDQYPLGLTGLISLKSKAFTRIYYSTTVQLLLRLLMQKHQFFGALSSLWDIPI